MSTIFHNLTLTKKQKHFKFLPVIYHTTKFLEKFTSSENLICSLFAKQATENIQKLKYGKKIKSSKQLAKIIDDTFFCM